MKKSSISNRAKVLGIPFGIFCALGAVAAMAAPQSDQAAAKSATGSGESRSKVVPLADLDLTTPEGLRAATERVRKVARALCLQLSDPDDLSRQSNFVACVDDATAAALPQIEQSAKAGHPKPSVAKN
jgi:UrcA family protein